MAGTKAIYRNHGFEEIFDIYIYIILCIVFYFLFMKIKKGLVLCGLLLLPISFVGCASTQHTIRVSDNVSMNSSIDYNSVDYEATDHFFLGGLLQASNQDVSNVCPAGKKPAKIINETRWYQALIGVITGSIYTPRKTYVICA